ncbi:uncharacterized protein LOC110239794 [Exaiptasia diaphana]|uniref:Uncharacterized protein n=1 Tax=Exaiptasia diaphana TaxID=2652724 RepID=A0A913XAZ6_EXADI|nr:uncharacterized protein LOC110239794 [Exaiptasia diaphana]
MRVITIDNAVVKGYHEFQIRPPPALHVLLPVSKEHGNRHDANACLVWVPELKDIPTTLWNDITDAKHSERVHTIAGLPIGRVPKGLAPCFRELLESSDVECINCEQTGSPCKSFQPWPEQQCTGGGAVIPCSYRVVTKSNHQSIMDKI